MNPIPPDWNDDKKLWKLLGQLPKEAAPTDFAHGVRQKLAKQEKEGREEWKGGAMEWVAVYRRWIGFAGLAVAAAAVMVFLTPETSWKAGNESVGYLLPHASDEVVELTFATQHDEDLTQDFEVIEHLDQL